ncbi:hypothetical protein ACFU53_02140 [Streptomyces sp. NPDC057474]|uniref:hypothetical protein n=1 Tax=Streptomyces sp. NPDC057474 TaxID=3346144 RepID=UPI0036A983EB
MTTRFRIDRILGDRPFAEIGDPTLAVEGDEERRLLVVAGACGALAGMQEFGTVRKRCHLMVATVPVVPTALTVAAPGRPLIGTSDGRVLVCSTG